MAESALRGSRGRIVRAASTDDIVESISPVRGQDVAVTLDIELQRDVQNLFKNWKLQKGQNVIEQHPMHGAAVVISLQTSEVLALASYPTFDPNTLEENYEELLRDEINQPLLHRATMSMYEPGSTVKPAVGLAGITAGVIGHGDTVECTGYLVLGGRKYDMGRCWSAPHENGFLDLEDAVQRSCNVYFETIGDRLKIEGLSQWLDRFGLGRPTGIGIPESAGRIPGQFRLPSYLKRSTAWFASIGQGKIGATPLQMANVTATIARNGVWMRPVLVLLIQTRTRGCTSRHGQSGQHQRWHGQGKRTQRYHPGGQNRHRRSRSFYI
jgi:penicillin-binding protein 2